MWYFLEQRLNQFLSINTRLRPVEQYPTLNNVSFYSSHFLQVEAATIGTHMGSSYTCLFVGYVEQSMLEAYIGTIPQLILRYMKSLISLTLPLTSTLTSNSLSPTSLYPFLSCLSLSQGTEYLTSSTSLVTPTVFWTILSVARLLQRSYLLPPISPPSPHRFAR